MTHRLNQIAFLLALACTNDRRLKNLLLLPLIISSVVISSAHAQTFSDEYPSLPFGLPKISQQQPCNKSLHSALLTAERDIDCIVSEMFTSLSLPLSYGIFKGRSALRDVPPDCIELLCPERLGLPTTTTSTISSDKSATMTADATRLFIATLLLLRRQIDASHDTILGATLANIEEAEFAATHRGKTDWVDRHPLTDSADLLHALVHRLEGPNVGEGNHTGYNNAKYWLAGGPKKLESPAVHNVRTELARKAPLIAPRCVQAFGLVSSSSVSSSSSCEEGKCREVEHVIIAGGGKNRTVTVMDGDWDGFAFVDACERAESGELSEEECNELRELLRLEITLFLRGELVKALGEDINIDMNRGEDS